MIKRYIECEKRYGRDTNAVEKCVRDERCVRNEKNNSNTNRPLYATLIAVPVILVAVYTNTK